jgi:hypothetical protein
MGIHSRIAQKVSTLSASPEIVAASGGVIQVPLMRARSSSVAPRATAHAFQT